jgi:hypothetical protein
MKFDAGEFFKELSNCFTFHLAFTVLMTTLLKACVCFCMCLGHNLPHIYQSKKCFKQRSTEE